MMGTQHIRQRIKDRYNGDFDLNLNGPMVTWAEFGLLLIIEELENKVKNLEEKIETDPDCE